MSDRSRLLPGVFLNEFNRTKQREGQNLSDFIKTNNYMRLKTGSNKENPEHTGPDWTHPEPKFLEKNMGSTVEQ